QTAPYNLLCTRQWMMIVPRSQEKFAGISVNSLGFAGSLLVKNQQTLEALKAIGPVTLLEHVGYSRD
ncbi:MAG: phosphorylase, partial [Cyanobacteria bacterium J06643_4]